MSTSASLELVIDNQTHSINIPNYDITCKQLMKYALEQSNYDRKNASFALFELSNGIERLINKHEIIGKFLQLANNNYKLILRKCHSIEKKLQVKQQKPTTVKAYYKKAKLIVKKEMAKENKMMKSETKVEPLVNRDLTESKSATISPNQLPNLSKLCNYHKNQLNEIISDKYKENVTFLTFLHMKLKEQNMIEKIDGVNRKIKTKYDSSDSGRHSDEAIGSNGCSRSNSYENFQDEIAYETWV